MKNINPIIGEAIPLVELSAQYRLIKPEVDAALNQVLSSNEYILGSEVGKFEEQFSKYIGVNYAVGVASGTDALTLALKSLNLKTGDGVIIPANVYPTAFGVSLSGVKLQLADIDPNTLNLSLDTVRKAYDQTTKAIVIVHLYGNPVNLDPILEFAKSNNIFVIEDCAQACGAEYKGKKVGSFGDVSCFSFYPTKNLGAYGDGGAVLTNSTEIFKQIKLLRMYGESSRYNSILVGHNSRLDELQAGILNVKLNYLDKWNTQRRYLAGVYKDELDQLPLEIVSEEESSESVYHLFVVKIKRRDELKEYLNQKSIVTGIHYPIAIHQTKSFKSLGYNEGDFPISEMACNQILSLPMYPELSADDVCRVSEHIKQFFS